MASCHQLYSCHQDSLLLISAVNRSSLRSLAWKPLKSVLLLQSLVSLSPIAFSWVVSVLLFSILCSCFLIAAWVNSNLSIQAYKPSVLFFSFPLFCSSTSCSAALSIFHIPVSLNLVPKLMLLSMSCLAIKLTNTPFQKENFSILFATKFFGQKYF